MKGKFDAVVVSTKVTMMKIRMTRSILFLIWFSIQSTVVTAFADTRNTNSNDETSNAKSSSLSDNDSNESQQHQKIDHMIEELLQSSEQTLQEYGEHTIETNPPSSMTERIKNELKSLNQLEKLKTTRDQLIHSSNMQQMKELQQRLEAMMVLKGFDHPTTTTSVTDGIDPTMKTETTTIVTTPELERILAPEILLAESESILMEWMRSVIPREVKQLDVNSFISSLSSIQSKQQHSTLSPTSSLDTAKTCKSVESTAEEVYYGLMRYYHDGIGLTDYTHSIVHQYTSPTFVVQTNDDRTAALSTVWWNRYIPQDWESLLPRGWESWKVWTFIIPDHIYHSFLRWWGGSGVTCAPPEAILQKSTLQGHCWPVTMMPKSPVVTIRLQPSIIVTAISIDHALEYPLKKQQQLNSAPKRIRAYGYAPCSENHCLGLGFDSNAKTLMAEFVYKIDDDRNVQTFPIVTTDNASASEASVCSATTTTRSCSAGNTTSRISAAVTLEILDNWGNEDYTCLYRVRVHGEPIN